MTLTFSMRARVTRWFNSAAVFERGPLVFSLPLKEDWSKLKQYQEKSADWQIVSTTAWNYAVQIGGCAATVSEHSVPAVPFDASMPPVTLLAGAKRYPEWTSQDNSAGPPPAGPVESSEPLQQITLIPYGAAKLRITEFPVLSQRSPCAATQMHPR